MTFSNRFSNMLKALRGEALYPTRAAGHVGPSNLASDNSVDQPYNYKPRIVADKLFNRWAALDRNVMAWEHPWAHKTTYSVSQYLWSNDIQAADADGQETQEGPVAAAIDELEEIHWRDAIYKACVGERTHRYALLVLRAEGETQFTQLKAGPGWRNPDDPFMYRVPAMRDVSQIDVFWESDVSLGAENYDPFGWPKSYRYYYKQNSEEYVDIDATRCVLVSTRPMDRTFMGMPMICPGWDYLIWSITGLDSLAWALSKFGQTSLAIPTFGSLGDTQSGHLQTAMQEWHKHRPLAYDQASAKAPEFVKPFDSADISPVITGYAQMYASSINAPMLWLLGEKVGAVSGSEIDTRNVQAMLHQTFTLWEPTLWRLLGAVDEGVLSVRKEYRLKNPLEAHLSELELANVWQGKSGAIPNLLQVSDVNTVRASLFGWDPIDGGDETPMDREQRRAEEMQSSLSFGGPGAAKKPPTDKAAPPRGESEAPSYDALTRAFKEHGSLRQVCKALHTSHNTVYKQRDRYQEEYGHEAPF